MHLMKILMSLAGVLKAIPVVKIRAVGHTVEIEFIKPTEAIRASWALKALIGALEEEAI